MSRIAVFVEGHSELIFIRETLLKYFDYQDIGIRCYNLHFDGNWIYADYSFGETNTAKFYQLINVGNDDNVLSEMLKREKSLKASGFEMIVGLRDMYSQRYKEFCPDNKINLDVNDKFIEGHRARLPNCLYFHFSIMEIEAWWLGMWHIFLRMAEVKLEDVIKKIGYNPEDIDPETIFHPASDVAKLYSLVRNERYDKRQVQVNAIVGNIKRDDIMELLETNKCNSFSNFFRQII